MIPLDRSHSPHKFPTHKDQRSVQVFVVLLYEVLVVLVRFPLVLVVEFGTGVMVLLVIDGKYDPRARFNASSILKRVHPSVRPELKGDTHILACFSS